MIRKTLATLATLAVLLVAVPGLASAHASKTTDDGVYKITWGLLDEPGFTYQKNRLDLIIRLNATNEGVGGITADNLTVELHKGDQHYELGAISAYRGAKGANAGPGNYTTANPVFLTEPGLYTLHVEGTILGTPVDVEIPAAHDYEPMSEIMFPHEVDLGGDTSALEARIAALESEVAALKAKAQTQATTPATVTSQPPAAPVPAPAIALVALAAVGAALLLRRRS